MSTLTKPTDPRIHLPINQLPLVSTCDYIQCQEGFVHPDRIMDVNVLLYIEEGSFHLYEDNIEYYLPEGSLTFLKQGLHHYGDTKCPDGTKWFFIHFFLPDENVGRPVQSTDMYDYHEGEPLNAHELYYALPKQIMLHKESDIVAKFLKFKDRYQSASWEDHISLNNYLYEILLDIYKKGTRSNFETTDERRVALIKEYLLEHSCEPFNSEIIENLVGLTYKHINLVFKNITGTTIQKYHFNLRMECGARLLKETSSSIAEISDMLGYDESFYFSNSFKRHYGMSPAIYRKNLRTKI